MDRIKPLSHLQIDILRVLWKRGEATVSEVHEGLRGIRSLATTTVATVLSRLEKAGIVRHRTEGRQYVYAPTVTERDLKTSMVSDLIDQLFHGDSRALVGHLLKESDIQTGDLDRVKEILSKRGGGDESDG